MYPPHQTIELFRYSSTQRPSPPRGTHCWMSGHIKCAQGRKFRRRGQGRPCVSLEGRSRWCPVRHQQRLSRRTSKKARPCRRRHRFTNPGFRNPFGTRYDIPLHSASSCQCCINSSTTSGITSFGNFPQIPGNLESALQIWRITRISGKLPRITGITLYGNLTPSAKHQNQRGSDGHT